MATAIDQNGATRVVMLGTGTPRPDPDRSGPATAIIVNETPYLVDFGPGVIRFSVMAFNPFGPKTVSGSRRPISHGVNIRSG
jgi:hypothetical protein